MKTYTFRTIIEPDEKGAFHGFSPSLPGCHTWGKSIEETKKKLNEAIELYISSLVEDGEKIPQEKGFEFFTTISTKINSNKKAYA